MLVIPLFCRKFLLDGILFLEIMIFKVGSASTIYVLTLGFNLFKHEAAYIDGANGLAILYLSQ